MRRTDAWMALRLRRGGDPDPFNSLKHRLTTSSARITIIERIK